MSLLDLAGQFLGGQSGQPGEGQQPANQSILTEVMSLACNHPGGVSGLLQQFEQGGLGEAVKSWVGTGPNLPVSADQVQSVLGSPQVEAMAARLGISPGQASSQLAQWLPTVIDHLTPNGQVPAGGCGALLEEGLSLLKGFGKP